MQCRMVEMRYKEVINICDGCRLGFVGDVEVLLPEGRVTALIVPGRVLRPLGVHQADRGRHHPHRQAGGAAAALPGAAAEAAAVLGEEKAAKRKIFPEFS